MRDTWGPPSSGWPSFCEHCGKKQAPDALHTCPVPDVAGRDVAVSAEPLCPEPKLPDGWPVLIRSRDR